VEREGEGAWDGRAFFLPIRFGARRPSGQLLGCGVEHGPWTILSDDASAGAVVMLRRVDPVRPDLALIREAAEILRAGALVAFPTETVYGLGARGLDPEAVARVYRAKGRPATHPLILHVLDEAEARCLASTWSDRAARLARAFWPGPLTLVVDRAHDVPAAVSGGGPSVAVRAPAHPVARALLGELGEPVAAPSANRYQSLSPTTAAHVERSLGNAVDLLLDGGACPGGIESTVVDVRGEVARVLRPGGISVGALRRFLPDVELVAIDAKAGESRPSPGMESRHYAPHAPMVLAATRRDALETARSRALEGQRVGVVLRRALAPSEVLTDRCVAHALGDDPVRYAEQLYAALHALDDEAVDLIVVEPVPVSDGWTAIVDRLRRSARSA
jgi:L-threonylcarbamoyladenylate synthase